MSKLDTKDLDANKARKHLSGTTEKQLLGLPDNVYKIKGKDIIENVLPGISETETRDQRNTYDTKKE